MTTRPSFIAASSAIHSGATLPSISSSRSPRSAPSARKAIGDPRRSLRQFGEGIGLGPFAEQRQRRPRAVLARGEFAVEPVERPIEAIEFRPGEFRFGGRIVGPQREEEVSGVFKIVDRHRQVTRPGAERPGRKGPAGRVPSAPVICHSGLRVERAFVNSMTPSPPFAERDRPPPLPAASAGRYPRLFFGA